MFLSANKCLGWLSAEPRLLKRHIFEEAKEEADLEWAILEQQQRCTALPQRGKRAFK